MLEQIQDVISKITNQEVHQSPNLPNEIAGDVSKEATNSITEGIKNAISSGNYADILSLVKGENTESNNVVNDIVSKFSTNLNQKSGVDASTSSGLASSIIPQVLGNLFDSKNGFDVKEVLSSFGGDEKSKGESGSFLDKLAGLGLDQNGDGKVNLDDAIHAVKNGKLGDMLGGFFKK